MSVSIEAIGAFTPVGGDAPRTMGSLLTQAQLLDDSGLEGAAGEPVSVAATPLPRRLKTPDRVRDLALIALEECAALAPLSGPVPLLLLLPCERDLGTSGTEVLDKVISTGSAAIDRASSEAIGLGRGGVADAALAADRLLQRGSWPGVYIVASDTLVTRSRLRRLIEDRRVLQSDAPEGMIPGEAAVALLVRRPEEARAGAVHIAGIGAAGDRLASAAAGPPPTSVAAGQALRRARVAPAGLAAVGHDASASPRLLEELALARGVAPLVEVGDIPTFTPVVSTGETGAASGLLGVAMLAFFLERSVVSGPALCLSAGEGTFRAAAVLIPGKSRR